MLWRESQLRAQAGAVFLAEEEVLSYHIGPRNPGEGMGGRPEMEVADERAVCPVAARFVHSRLKSRSYSEDTEQFALEEGLGLQVETGIHKKGAEGHTTFSAFPCS